MAAQAPQISELADRWAVRKLGHHIRRVVVAFGRLVERGDPQINLAHLKTSDLDIEVEAVHRQRLELLGEQPVVPGRELAQPVIRDHKRPGLFRGEVIETYGRHFGYAEQQSCQIPEVDPVCETAGGAF